LPNSVKTPFYVHALVSKSYIDSAYKCEGGSSRIAKSLWRRRQELGAAVIRREEVVCLHQDKGRIVAAETVSGRYFYGNHFISNVHPRQTMQWLDSDLIKPIYRRRLEKIENSIAAFMVNVVLKPGKVAYKNHNIYWNRSEDSLAALNYGKGEWPANYALYYSRDPQQPEFAESVALLTYMHSEETAIWKDSENRTAAAAERTSDYDHYKQTKAHRLLQQVAQHFPEIQQHLHSYNVATPLTFRDYMGTHDGSMYGLMNDVQQPEYTRVPIQTKVPNLLLTGQNVGLHGVLGVSITAVATAGYLLGLEHLVKKINQNRS